MTAKRRKAGRPPGATKDRLFRSEVFRKWLEDHGRSYPDAAYLFRRTAEDMGLNRRASQSTIHNWAHGISEPQVTDLKVIERFTKLTEEQLVRPA